MLTHWSVAKAGSNDEKTGDRKSRWTVPVRNALCFRKSFYIRFYSQVYSVNKLNISNDLSGIAKLM